MAKAWAKFGPKALEKCVKNQPAAFCKMYVLLVPREMKVEHSRGVHVMCGAPMFRICRER